MAVKTNPATKYESNVLIIFWGTMNINLNYALNKHFLFSVISSRSPATPQTIKIIFDMIGSFKCWLSYLYE